jgi:hypothetical protein
VAGWRRGRSSDEEAEMEKKEKEKKTPALKSVTKLLHNALLGFSCRSKSYKDFRAYVKAYFRSAHI